MPGPQPGLPGGIPVRSRHAEEAAVPAVRGVTLRIVSGEAGALMRRTACGVFLVVCLIASVAQAAPPGVHVRTVKGEFDDIKERLVMALENRGLVINYTARIGAMLERTGRDLGRNRPIYGKAELVEFCSAQISRDTMEADPHNIVFCPYAIAVYTLPQTPGQVYLSWRAPAVSGEKQVVSALGKVEKLLADIVSEAIK